MPVLPKHTRAPGFLEKQYICRNTNRYWSNINIIAKYSSEIRPDQLRQALRQLCLKHTILVSNYFRIKGDQEYDLVAAGTNFEFRPLWTLSFDDVVSFTDVDVVDHKTYESINELTTPMNSELPLWRIIVFRETKTKANSQYVCIYFDHAIFDGRAAVDFHKLLIDELNNIDANISDDTQVIFDYEKDIDSVNVLPCPESSGLFDVSYWYLAKLHINLWWNYYFPTTTKHFANKTVTMDISNVFRLVKISPDKVKQTLCYCRQNGITMTPFLNSVLLKAFKETVGANIPTFTDDCSIRTCIAVSGREFLPGAGPFGVYVGFDFFDIPKAASGILLTAKSLYQRLNSSIASRVPYQVVGMYNYGNVWDTYRKKLGKTEGRATLVVSNLGRTSTDTSKCIYLDDIWFSACLGLVTHMLANIITTPSGDLNVLIGALPEYEPYIDNFTARFLHFLDEEIKK